MKPLFSLKTQRWPGFFQNKKQIEKGAVTLISAFMVFIFTALGLTTLVLTQINLKLSQYRKNSMLLDYASENGIKQGFDQISNAMSKTPQPLFLSADEFIFLNQDALKTGKQLIQFLFSDEMPLLIDDQWEYMRWTCQTSFSKTSHREHLTYFTSEYEVILSSEGKVYDYSPSRTKILSGSMKTLTGNIPLPAIPLLKDRNADPIQIKDFFEKNHISIFSPGENNLVPEAYVSDKELVPDEATQQIKEALNIKTFNPQDLSDKKLRQVLGLDIVDEPVPEGVYLIKDDLGLGGLFIQGDVKEMILAVEQDFQVLQIAQEAGIWILKFNPQKHETYFITPFGSESYNLTPKGIVIVNGGVDSLGGGIVSASGEIQRLKGVEKAPSLLKSVNLTLISSKEIIITDHIIHEGVQWIDSVPYIKDSQSQLNIFAGGNNITEKQNRTGGITIDSEFSNDLKIQASLTSSTGEFSVKGHNKTVNLLGSVHASQYSTSQNQLNVFTDPRFLAEENLLLNSPKTQHPILYIAEFKLKEWTENE
ncbi:MAG: hypothetical protein R6V00_06950 [Candidatus Aminicenantes bacterium]